MGRASDDAIRAALAGELPSEPESATHPLRDPLRIEVEGPPPPSREALRSRRKRAVRAKTVSVKRLTKRDLEIGRLLYPEDEHADVVRPKTPAECREGIRPCPFVGCEHHLYLDVSARTGAIKVNFPDLEPDELTESCALDVASRGGATLEEVGSIMNLTRERIRQIEVSGMAKMRAADEMFALRDYVEPGPIGKRRLPLLGENDSEDDDEPEAHDDQEPDDGAGFDVDHFASDELDSE